MGQTWEKRLNSFADRHPEASFSFYARELSNGTGVAAYDESQLYCPASCLKLVTTAGALEMLGPDYRFVTEVYYTGELVEGVLKGDLIIMPAGDPTMLSEYFENLPNPFEAITNALKEKGIRHIQGKLRVDLSRFENEVPPSWVYEDIGNYYGAHPAGLNVYDNRIKIFLKSPDEAGRNTTLVKVEPYVNQLEFDNRVVAANISYDNAYIFGVPGQFKRTIKGEIPKGRDEFVIKGSLPDPAMFFMEELTAHLRNESIEVPTGAISTAPLEKPAIHKLLELSSPPLADIINVVNKESHNMFAEALLKAIALQKAGVWSREEGIRLLQAYWKEKGLGIAEAVIHDGSGLSRFNAVSARQLVEILDYMNSSPYASAFRSSLSVAGESGTLEYQFKSARLKGKILGKSGSMHRVICYAGYTENEMAFAIMCNNYRFSSVGLRKELQLLLAALLP